jgi:hypothetical protein
MPSRTLPLIRRHINRLCATVSRNVEKSAAFQAALGLIQKKTDEVNQAYQRLQAAVVSGNREREERETAIGRLLDTLQVWRPLILMAVPGANESIRALPPGAPTVDELVQLGKDMISFIENNDATAGFREDALREISESVEAAAKESGEARVALGEEKAAAEAYTEACDSANTVLVRGTEMVRSYFGATSPEYKQFIQRESAEEEAEMDKEAKLGEVAETEASVQ